MHNATLKGLSICGSFMLGMFGVLPLSPLADLHVTFVNGNRPYSTSCNLRALKDLFM